MGKRHRKFLDSARCIYCGGLTLAATVDHVPPIVMFDNRARPKGLEFPSCADCNAGTRKSELVAALVSRAYPDRKGADFRADLGKILRGLAVNVPGILQELYVPKASAKFTAQRLGNPTGGFIRLDGPIVFAHLQAFGAKLGFALHFHKTGRPVPVGGGVIVRIFSNLDAIEGRISDDIFEVVGPPQTLVQGSFDVGDQFRFSSGATDDGAMSMSFAAFRRSFAIIMCAAEETSKLGVDGDLPTKLFQPGDLANPIGPPEFISIGIGKQFLR